MAIKKVATAGGHSKKAPGASCYIDEYTEDRKCNKAFVSALKARGVAAKDCSNEYAPASKELARECALANAYGGDLFVAWHFNAASKTSGKRGVEVWYYTGSKAGKSYAEKISKKLANLMGLPNRGAKATTGLYVLRHTKAPAILIEVCFVDAKGDANAYKAVGASKVAAAVADVLTGKTATTTTDSKPATSKPTTTTSKPATSASSGSSSIKAVQKWAGTTADGVNGPKTKKALCKMLQKELNKQYKAGLSVDGVWGPKTKSACVNVKQGAKGNITRTLQGCLIVRGYGTNGFDGVFGGGTAKAVKAFQRSKGLTVDGVAGKNTWAKLLG